MIHLSVSIAFQTDKPLAAYGPLAVAAENYGFDGVTLYSRRDPAHPRRHCARRGGRSP